MKNSFYYLSALSNPRTFAGFIQKSIIIKMDEKRLFEQKDKLLPSLTAFLKGIKDPETNNEVLFFQFDPKLPVFLTGNDLKNPSKVKNYSEILEPKELASLLLGGVLVSGMAKSKEEKDSLRIYDQMLKRLNEIESDFVRCIRELRKKMLATFFSHIQVKDFLINYLDGHFNDTNRLRKSLEEMRGEMNSLKQKVQVDEKKVNGVLDRACEFKKELERFVEGISRKSKDKVIRFTSPTNITSDWNQNGVIDALCVEPQNDTEITGLGLHRPINPAQDITYTLTIYQGEHPNPEDKLFETTVCVPFLPEGQKDEGGKHKFFKYTLPKSIFVKGKTKILLNSSGTNVSTFKGSGGENVVKSKQGIEFRFFKGSNDSNGTGVEGGMFPAIFAS